MTSFFSLIANIFRWLIYALIILFQFLVIVALGILVGIIYTLPWVLRVLAVLIWFYGGYQLVMVISDVYTPFTPEFPVMVLQFFVVIVQLTAFVSILILSGRLVWGALYFTGGIPLWIALSGIPSAFANWRYANFIFRILPPALWVMLLLYITLKGKAKKNGKTFAPPFMRTPDFLDSMMEKLDPPTAPPHPMRASEFETRFFGLGSKKERPSSGLQGGGSKKE